MKPSEIGPWASDGGAKQMIKAGQLRYWDGQSPRNGQSFLVLKSLGKFYTGSTALKEDHWEILWDGNTHSGWSSSLLERISKALDGEQ